MKAKRVRKDKWVAVDPQHVLTVKDGKMYLFGEPITDIEASNLQSEAKTLKAFRIWRIMQETLKERAVKDGFIESLTWERTLSGKMLVHALGIIKSIVEVLESYQQKKV